MAVIHTVNFLPAPAALGLIGCCFLPQEHGVAATPSLSISGETVSGQEDGATSFDPGLAEEASHHSRTHTLGEAPPPGRPLTYRTEEVPEGPSEMD